MERTLFTQQEGKEIDELGVELYMQVLNEAYPPGSLFFTTIPENPSTYTYFSGEWVLKDQQNDVYVFQRLKGPKHSIRECDERYEQILQEQKIKLEEYNKKKEKDEKNENE